MLRVWIFALLVAFSAAAEARTLLVLGDSLSAAYGIGQKEGWVTLLEERLRDRKFNYTVVNASISGETTAGGAARIDGLLARSQPEIVIVALGANDGLRGLAVAQTKTNLMRIARAAKGKTVKVLLVGMRLPPNYGLQYTKQFFASFEEVARAEKAAYVPFMLEGFADRTDLFQGDSIHPTAAAQPLILDNIWPALEPLLRR